MKKTKIPMNHKSFEKVHKRVEILDKVIEGRITEIQAGIELGIKERQIRNLLKTYKKYGEEGLVHGLVGVPSNRHIKDKDKIIIVDVIKQDDFKDCKLIFITEKLEEIYGVNVSKETVRNIMIDEKVREKATKKHHIYRSRRERKDFYGEMSQYDGSYHKWFEDRGDEYCLLLDVDDATGKIQHAKLCDNEGYECTVDFWKENILLNGVPRSIYLDKFSTYKVNHAKAVNTKDLRTNFDRSMRKFGCNLISAHSAPAKGRVEKCNGTLQNRLVRELRLAKISTVDEANKFIRNVFIPKYNAQFSVEAKKEGDLHVKITKEQIENLDWIFAREQLRSLSYDYVIQYKNRCYQIEQSKGYTVYPKKRLLVAETIDGKLRIHAGKTTEDKLVVYKEINYNTVKRNRAIYRNKKHKIDKERLIQAKITKKEEKHRISKEKQIHYKAQRLIGKL